MKYNKIKIGDKVKIVKRIEGEYPFNWVESMEGTIGNIFTAQKSMWHLDKVPPSYFYLSNGYFYHKDCLQRVFN